MGLWGVTTAATDKPKFLPVDSNAAGSTGAREHAIAVKGGWGLAPGLAASGNDNTAATPEYSTFSCSTSPFFQVKPLY